MLKPPAIQALQRTVLAVLAVCLPWIPSRAGSEPAPPALSATERLAGLRTKYGEDMLYEVDEQLKIIFATGTDQKALDEAKLKLTAHARAMRAGLFTTGLKDYVTIVVPREWKGSGQGFYHPEERSIIAKTAGAQLVHEFTHALHWDDMQSRHQFHQNWVIEGLATLCESSEVVDGHMIPRPNYRLKIIKRQVERGHHVPWPIYVTWNQRQFMKAPGNHYSQAQSMMFFLHHSGRLKQWYDAYVTGFAKDPTGAFAFEKVFAKSLPEIEKDWVAWVNNQSLPKEAPRPAPPVASNPPPPQP